MPSSTRNARAKSTIPEPTAAIGITSRGKYTFWIKFALATRLLDELVSPLAKNCQGTSAA